MKQPNNRQLAALGVVEHAHRRSFDLGGNSPSVEYNLGRIRTVYSCLPCGRIHAIVLVDGKEVACDTFTPHPEGFFDDGTAKPINPNWERPKVTPDRVNWIIPQEFLPVPQEEA